MKMRIFALILAACAAATLNWSGAAHAEQRLAHISIETLGRGDPVVLIPGLSTPRAVWDGLAPELAKTHQVLLVQVNGFAAGDPGGNLQPGVLDGLVSDLHAYLADHHLKSVPVIGHSMGGLAALKLAIGHPHDVDRLLVVDALPFFGVLVDEHATVDALRPMAEMMKNKIAAAYGKPADPATTEANVKGLAVKPQSIARMKAWAIAADPRVTGQAFSDDMTTDLRPELGKLSAPVTLVYPSGAGPDPERTLAFYERQYSGAKVKFVPIADAGHFVMLDQPEKFAAAVADFLK
jgi:pimeloyl-ACP methyl ester carboxylesterase